MAAPSDDPLIPEGVALVSRDTTVGAHQARRDIKQQEVFYRTLVDSLPLP